MSNPANNSNHILSEATIQGTTTPSPLVSLPESTTIIQESHHRVSSTTTTTAAAVGGGAVIKLIDHSNLPSSSSDLLQQQQQQQQDQEDQQQYGYSGIIEERRSTPTQPLQQGHDGTAQQQLEELPSTMMTTAAVADYPSTAMVLETAAHAAAIHNNNDNNDSTTTTTTTITLAAAMQEAATIVMEAHERMQYDPTYTYADANAVMIRTTTTTTTTNPTTNTTNTTNTDPTTTTTTGTSTTTLIEDGNTGNHNNNNDSAVHHDFNPNQHYPKNESDRVLFLQTSHNDEDQNPNKKRDYPSPNVEGVVDPKTLTVTTAGSDDDHQHMPPTPPVVPNDHTEDRPDPNNKKPRLSAPSPRTSWEERIRQLQAYRESCGDLLVPTRYKGFNNLGKFVHNMREQYKVFHRQDHPMKCGLTEVRIKQLEEMDFQWTTKRHVKQDDDWGKRFDQLIAFKGKNGHCRVPHGYEMDPSFAEWVHRQRTTYQTAMKEEMTTGKMTSQTMKERFEKLKEIGFLFQVQSNRWMDHWEELQSYRGIHGDCLVPTHYADNPTLGRWVHTQRHQRRLQEKGRRSCMTQNRIDLLDQLGFSWEVRPALDRPRASWQHRLEELQAYAERNGGSVQVDVNEMPNLHAWCVEQRQRLQWYDRHNGDDRRINPERVQALQAIGFTKDVNLSGIEMGEDTTTLHEDTPPVVDSSPTTSPTRGRMTDPVGARGRPPPIVVMDAGEVVDKVMGDTHLGGTVMVGRRSPGPVGETTTTTTGASTSTSIPRLRGASPKKEMVDEDPPSSPPKRTQPEQQPSVTRRITSFLHKTFS